MQNLAITQIAPAFKIRDVETAAPVLSVRSPHRCLDILVRHSTGHMSLFMGRNRLCTVELDKPPQFHAHPVSVGQAVADQFSLLAPGCPPVRYTLAQACFMSPLVNRCLAAMSFSFESANVMRRITAIYREMLCTRTAHAPASVIDKEWHVFQHVILKSAAVTSDPPYHSRDRHDTFNVSEDHAWAELLSTEYNASRSSSQGLGPVCPIQAPSDPNPSHQLSAPDLDLLQHVLHALHLLYEDHKLGSLPRHTLVQLANLNIRLSIAILAPAFVDHYRKDFPELPVFSQIDTTSLPPLDSAYVPSILDYLVAVVSDTKVHPYPVVSPSEFLNELQTPLLTASWRGESPFEISRLVVQFFHCLYAPSQREKAAAIRAEEVLLMMVENGFTKKDLEFMPFGIILPLRDALWACRHNPSPDWPHAAFVLIGREDLVDFSDIGMDSLSEAETQRLKESEAFLRIMAAASTSSHRGASVLPEHDTAGATSETRGKNCSDANESDGCYMTGSIYQLRFSEDRRIEEVRRILRSTDYIYMTPVENSHPDSSLEFDIVVQQKQKLGMLLQKRFAAPVGRGAFTLRTYVPSDPTKALPVPKICTTGLLHSHKGAKVNISPNNPLHFQWGEFHNGVAAGLRIVAAEASQEMDTKQILTRSWIVNNRPSDISTGGTHAGMLLAFGLGGYLPALLKTDYYQYLAPRHDLTSIGLMLGLATGNLGSMHEKLTKMMCLHIKYFNEAGFSVPDFNVSVNVQTAAILGLGLLHQGSSEHLIVEGLFAELAYRPKPGDPVNDREGLALAAGLSIGLIDLGNGSSAISTSDGRLIMYANGYSGKTSVMVDVHSESGPAKSDSGNAQDRGNSTLADSETSRIKEGNFVNADVVSPGALLALALIYLKTNDKRLADRIVVPKTLYSLDRARPHHVYLRILARSIIMWDDIKATKQWILEAIPCLLQGLNSDGVPDPFDLLGKITVSSGDGEQDVDVSGILQARAFATAGACTAMALRFAGTYDPSAVALLMEACHALEKALLDQEGQDESKEWVYMTCLCSSALAISVVAAGSGDLSIFRMLRRLRKRRRGSVEEGRYGFHLALHLAIGFLFLSGGCQTFGTSNIAIFGLLCALYPPFPQDLNDNQYHLQALRHLYVLAVEPRCIETRDVNTGTSCCVNVEIKLKDGSKISTMAPCIVPEASNILEIAVVSERYLDKSVPINPAVQGRGWFSSTRSQILLVKRRTGHLPHSSDPKGCKGILARTLGQPRLISGDDRSYFEQVEHLVNAFSADPNVLAFVKYFCCPALGRSAPSNKGSVTAKKSVDILYECLSTDKPEAVKIYLDAERAAEEVRQGRSCTWAVGSLMIADAYIHGDQISKQPLVRPAFLASNIQKVREAVDYREVRHGLVQYVRSKGNSWPQFGSQGFNSRNILADLGIALRLHGIPKANDLAKLSMFLKSAMTAEDTEKMWVYFTDDNRASVIDNAVEVLMNAVELEG